MQKHAHLKVIRIEKPSSEIFENNSNHTGSVKKEKKNNNTNTKNRKKKLKYSCLALPLTFSEMQLSSIDGNNDNV